MRLVKYSDNLEKDESKTILWEIGKKNLFARMAEGINGILPVMLFFVAILMFFAKSPRENGDLIGNVFIYYLIFFGSLFAHVFAHYCAAVAYKKNVGRVGLISSKWFFTDWFIEADKDEFTLRQKIQMNAAGVEANLLIAGIACIISSLRGNIGEAGVFLIGWNLIIAGVNILPVYKSDGEAILSVIFGRSSILNDTIKFFTDKEFRTRIKKGGRIGFVWKGIYITKYLIDVSFTCGLILIAVLIWTNNITI